MDFARIWTGFNRQSMRGNIEARNGAASGNYLDPMTITASDRDVWPKVIVPDLILTLSIVCLQAYR